jgi:hypothetical protein
MNEKNKKYFSLYLISIKKGVKTQGTNERNFKKILVATTAAGKKFHPNVVVILYYYYLLFLVWKYSTRGCGEFPVG